MDNLIIRLSQRPLYKKKIMEGVHQHVVVKYLEEPLKEAKIRVNKEDKLLTIIYYNDDNPKLMQLKDVQEYKRYNKTVELRLKNNMGIVGFQFKDEEAQDRFRVAINAISSSSEAED